MPSLKVNRVDVYTPGEKDLLNSWVRKIISNGNVEPDSRIRYWVHIRDVERAENELHAHNEYGEYTICGRRAWSQQMVISEIRLLWNRYTASIEGTHTAETLGEIPSPAASSEASIALITYCLLAAIAFVLIAVDLPYSFATTASDGR